MEKIKIKKTNGITLIALVITIIVLLILAGVTIASLSGDNGILQRASEAKKKTNKEDAEESIKLLLTEVQMEKNLGTKPLKDLLEEKFGQSNVKPNGDGFKVIKDGYEATIDANGNLVGEVVKVGTGGEIPIPPTTGKTDGSWDATKGVNSPKLKDNMKLVTYSNGNWVEDTTNLAYKYVAGTGNEDNISSEWANAVLDGNYYVWIPRYAYKIDNSVTYTSQAGTSHKIDVKFVDNSVKGTTSDGYIVHPAFTFGTEELSGIWVGKYETSRSDATETQEGTAITVKIQPNVRSYRNITVSTMFEAAKSLSKPNVDAHMMKNTEWGAVAYLAQSPYGRNGTEVSVNQCSDYITGAGKTKGINKIYESTTYSQADIEPEQKYDGAIGKMSSTTGNVYGVYDMSGGALEYVMGVYGTGNPLKPSIGSSSGFDINKFPESKHYDVYENKTNDYGNYEGGKDGDATKEIQNWNNDFAYFVNSDHPFFLRGGRYNNSGNSGLLCFTWGNGNAYGDLGFRLCLVV